MSEEPKPEDPKPPALVPNESKPVSAGVSKKKRFRRRFLLFLALVLLACWGWHAWTVQSESDLEAFFLRASDLSRADPKALEAKMDADTRTLVRVLDGLDELQVRMRDSVAMFNRGENDFYSQETNDQIHQLLLAYNNYRAALYRILFYYGRHETAPAQLRDRAFLLAYTAGVTLFYRGLVFVKTFADSPTAIQKLNEGDLAWGLRSGTYDEVRARTSNPKNVDLLAESKELYARRKDALVALGEGPGGANARLRRVVEDASEFVERTALETYGETWKIALDKAKRESKENYLFFQTQISAWLGDHKIKHPRDGAPLITLDQVREVHGKLEPGDVLLERRNWFYSNAFLPGFWPHAALYVGNADDVSKLGLAEDARVAKHMKELAGVDDHGDPFRLIEAQSEGVVFTSVEHSLGCDALVVLRPRRTREQRNEAIARAFSHVGKPYDFDFDFFSADKLVCTELVYRAYDGMLQFDLVKVAGRMTLPAIDIARMYARESGTPGRQFDMVCFLDGDEEAGTASFRDEAAFIASKDRSGFAEFGN